MLAQAEDGGKGLKRTLGAGNLVALGVGAIIGAGLFVRTAAAAGQAAGPAVTLSFIIAAIGCAFAGLCYAEFAAMIPISGSAYAYSYVTMGETVAWIIGWALIMEYALGAATVSIAWSEYLNKLLGGSIPYEWSHSPFESVTDTAGVIHHGIMNAPSLVILLLLTLLLIKGTQESAIVNAIIVFVKVAIVIIFIVLGWQFIKPENHTPYFIPADQPPLLDASGKIVADYSGVFKHGWGGVLGGAAIVFFAFIGFDAVSTQAGEAKNPKKDVPFAIVMSLVICTVLYIIVSLVLTGMVKYNALDLKAPVASAFEGVGMPWATILITVAAVAGLTSVMLVMMLGQTRIFLGMAKDGLLPRNLFGSVHPKFKTPFKSTLLVGAIVSVIAAFTPIDKVSEMCSMGTLLAFSMVCLAVWILRFRDPNRDRPFKVSGLNIVAPLPIH